MRFKFNKPFASGGAEAGKSFPASRKSMGLQTLFLICAASLLFIILYRRFLFGQAVYLYTDIGSDSVASSYPILVMLSRLFRSGDFSSYTLSCGLGADTAATFLQYINPLKTFLLFFNRTTMPAGLLLQLYLDTVLCAFAAWRFFLLLTDHSPASMISGLLFAYSGYAVLWSQNLSFGVCLTMFALTMLAVEAFVRKRTLPRFLALTGILSLYLYSSYFFCYMTAIFVIIYLPVRSLLLRDRFGEFLRGYLLTALSAAAALVLSAVAVVAITGNFLGSVRTGDASRSLLSLFRSRPRANMLYACIARLFSENLTGIGDGYKGPDNYYEIAVLSVSALFLFAFFYLLYQRKTRVRTLLITAACVAALLFPGFRYIFNMNPLAMRFSFWITLLISMAVAFFLKELLTCPDGKGLLFSGAAAVLFTAVTWFILHLTAGALHFELSGRTMIFCAAWILAYALVLIAVGVTALRMKMNPGLYGTLHSLLPAALLLLAAGEILIMRHDTLYLRLYLTKEQFGTSVYSDVTYEATSDLADEDPGLYRIASTENYFYANEGLVDGFNGTTLYNNTNPASLRTLAAAHGTNEVNTPYFMTGYARYYQYTLLGGRYLIREENGDRSFTEAALFDRIAAYPDRTGLNGTDPSGTEANGTEANGTDPNGTEANGSGETVKAVYKNKNALPFGYLLTQQIPEKDYMDSDLMTRMHLLTENWFLTGESEAPEEEQTAAGTEDSAADAGPTAAGAPDPAADAGPTAAGAPDSAADAGQHAAGTPDPAGDDERYDLFSHAVWKDPHNLTVEHTENGIRLTATGEDPYIYVYFDRLPETADTSLFLRLRADTGKSAMHNFALYYLADEASEPDPGWIEMIFYNKYYPEYLGLMPDHIAGFRFDPDDKVKSVTLTSMELIRCTDPLSHFSELAATQLRDEAFANDTYTATVTSEAGDSVLCIPLLYTKYWTAEVDGNETEVMNINGGLLGIRVGKGTHDITVRYRIPHLRAAMRITLAALGLYLAAWMLVLISRLRSRSNRQSAQSL